MENKTNQSGSNNRNRSQNRNRNRNNNRGGGSSQNRNQSRNHSGGGQNRNHNRNRNRKPKVVELTLGQKILKAISFGAIDPNKNINQSKSKNPNQKNPNQQTAQKKSTSKPKAKPQADQSKKKARAPKIYEVTSPRLYVGNLDYEAAESDLEELFNGAGNVIEAEVVTNSRTQQSKGFAFVEMGSIEEAKRAVEILHDQDFMGRKLLVSGAKSEGPRQGEESTVEAA